MVDINTEWSSGRMNGQAEQRKVKRNDGLPNRFGNLLAL